MKERFMIGDSSYQNEILEQYKPINEMAHNLLKPSTSFTAEKKAFRHRLNL